MPPQPAHGLLRNATEVTAARGTYASPDVTGGLFQLAVRTTHRPCRGLGPVRTQGVAVRANDVALCDLGEEAIAVHQ